MRRRGERAALKDALSREGFLWNRMHRQLPAVLALLGQRRRARLYLRYAAARWARGPGELDVRYRAFARRLAERIG